MKKVLLVLGAIATLLGTAIASEERPFQFQLEQSEGPRGFAVEGYVYNPSPWRITNVRLQVDSLDSSGTLLASAGGWVWGTSPLVGAAIFTYPSQRPRPRIARAFKDSTR